MLIAGVGGALLALGFFAWILTRVGRGRVAWKIALLGVIVQAILILLAVVLGMQAGPID